MQEAGAPTVATQVNLTGPSNVNADAVSTAFTLTSQDREGYQANVTADRSIFSGTLISLKRGNAGLPADSI